MNNFFNAFSKSSSDQWKEQIIKDLKGKEHELLEFADPIEEINFKAYYHQDEVPANNSAPGSSPFNRGSKRDLNDWNNGIQIIVSDESEANREALHALMTGADLLLFKSDKNNVDWKKVLNEVKAEFIQLQFEVSNTSEIDLIQEITGNSTNVAFNFDPFDGNLDFDSIKNKMNDRQFYAFKINGFGIQQGGATTWQQIAFCLNAGHETLLQLMESGLTIDEAAATIHFHIGVGSNYFLEISKIRALRNLWSKIIAAYQPKHNCSHNCSISAVIGHMNKSLQDPYTNLLRQTTEVMSATNGADNIIVLPYDLYSEDGVSELSKRMALNISLILKEESYLDRVIDPVGGSYSVERLTETVGKKAWDLFKSLEAKNGLTNDNTLATFIADVSSKADKRIELFNNGETVGIGINKYPDPNEKSSNWKETEGYLGLPNVVFEKSFKTITA
jgi:methylmalonyl-CoA mutase